MRSSQLSKITKKQDKHPKVNKKKYKNSKLGWRWSEGLSSLHFNDLNEVFRKNKARYAETKGRTWKVVPKDSCEVYKLRRKRETSNRRKDDESSSEASVSKMDVDKRGKKKYTKKYQKKKVPKKYMPKRKHRKRSQSESSVTSSSKSTSCTTASEMEYD